MDSSQAAIFLHALLLACNFSVRHDLGLKHVGQQKFTNDFCRLLNTRTLTCKQWIIIEATSAVVLELAVEILLILRSTYRFQYTDWWNFDPRILPVYAMYSVNRFIISSVIVLLVVQIIVMIATVTVSMLKATTSTNCATVIPMEMMAYTYAVSVGYHSACWMIPS